MSEYIIWESDGIEVQGHRVTQHERREEIVRCSDCVYYDIAGEEYRFYSDKVYCEKLWKYVEPDGFCKWAEQRESGDA